MSDKIKTDRVLELFFRAFKGESLSIQKLADFYQVSSRSISRDISSLKAFLADQRDLVGNAELVYSSRDRSYRLEMEDFITNKELLAMTKALIGCRPLRSNELVALVSKLKKHTTTTDRIKLDNLILKEMHHYKEISCDCDSILDNVWNISEYIAARQLITISYHKMDGSQVKHRIKPVSLMFSEYYYYLIAYECDGTEPEVAHYFRVDRIVHITAHRETFRLTKAQEIDEGELRKLSHFMWPGRLAHIRFEFSGPSLQAILDRIPTAKLVDISKGKQIIDADVYGYDGIKMFLLGQGSWVKPLSPPAFVEAMKKELQETLAQYD